MRELTMKEIESLASQEKVKQIAVENFLMSVSNNGTAENAMLNLWNDSRVYNWNNETIAAIRQGIQLAEKEETIMKKGKEKKANKASKKQHKAQVMKMVEEINRAEPLIIDNEPEIAECKNVVVEQKPIKERKLSKYQIIAQYLREHTGQFSRKELLDALEKEGIVKGTSTAALSDFKSIKYKPSWLSEALIEENGKIFLR